MTNGPTQPSEDPTQPSGHDSSSTEPDGSSREPASRTHNLRIHLSISAVTLLAIVLTLISFFLSYVRQTMSPTGSEQELHIKDTPWQRVYEPEIPPEEVAMLGDQHVARYGIPLSIILAVLLASLIIRTVLIQRNQQGFTELARLTTVVGGSALAVSVFMIGIEVSARLSYNTTAIASLGDIVVRYSLDAGFWLLLCAGIAGLAVCLFSAAEPFFKKSSDKATPVDEANKQSDS